LEKSAPIVREKMPAPPVNTRAGFIQIHLAVFLFGFSGLLGKLIHASPPVITFGRTFFAGIALLLYLILIRGSLSIRSRRDALTILLSGVVLAAHWCAFFQSIHASSVSVALITFATFPLWIAFLEPIFFRERLAAFDGIVAAAVAAGLVFTVPAFDWSDRTTQGILWGMFSSVSFAFLAVLNRMHVRTYPPLVVAFYQLAFAAVVCAPFAVPAAASLSGSDLLLLLILGIVCTAAAQTLYIGSLRYIRARSAGIIIGLEPVYGILLAVILLGEIPTVRTAVGGMIILAAVYGAMVRKHTKATLPAEQGAHRTSG
jgi:drug/metabolite transporter (DMT)-like permease